MEEKLYSEDELFNEAISFFNGDKLAANVWIKKYALKSKENNSYFLEKHPNETVERIAKEIHRIEQKYKNPLSYKEIFDTLKDFKHFIFGGSILYGLGNENYISSLGNCFFINNNADSYGGILNLDETLVQMMKRRGGVGVTLEHLRPSTATVNNSAQTSTGIIPFAERFSNSTREVAQDGRRGALMISLLVTHPNVEEFITAKDELNKITGANISLKVTNEFMDAVINEQDFLLRWPTEKKINLEDVNVPYNKIVKLEDGTYIKKVKAKSIWDKITKQAHKSAEPGILFWDKIKEESPADMYKDEGFESQGVNPCAEIVLGPYGTCRLGSINLLGFVKNLFSENTKFDWSKFDKYVRRAQRFMDDIVDLEEEKILKILNKIDKDKEPEEIKRTEREIWKKVLVTLKKGRRTGLGMLGLGDTLAALNYEYGTKEATEFAEKITKRLALNSYKESVKLAKERGCFPVCNVNKESNNPYISRVISNNFSTDEYNEYVKYGRRNIANLAIAPTGSIATIAQTTSGIEPVFMVAYTRRRKVNPNEEGVRVDYTDQNGDTWEEYNVLHPQFIKWIYEMLPYGLNSYLKENNLEHTIENTKIYLEQINQDELNELIKTSPWENSESHNIDYYEKVRMQGKIQKYIDHSISITHNLHKDVDVDTVKDLYDYAWKCGVKGVTIYRDGSRSGVLISNDDNKEDEFPETNAPKRPKELPADYYIAKAKGKEYAVIVGKLHGKPYEIFAFENPPRKSHTTGHIVKIRKGQYKFVNGEFEIENLELAADKIEERSVTLMASMLLRHGAPIPHVNKTIQKIDENIVSFSSAVRRTLSRYTKEDISGEYCPYCGDKMLIQDGCMNCVNPECGYSKC